MPLAFKDRHVNVSIPLVAVPSVLTSTYAVLFVLAISSLFNDTLLGEGASG